MICEDRREKPFTEQLNVGVLLLVPDDFHQVLGRVDGIGTELIVDDGQPCREIERRDGLEPLVDHEEAFPVGFHLIEAFAPKGLLRGFNSIYQIGKPIERFDDPCEMFSTARSGLTLSSPLEILLLIYQIVIKAYGIGLRQDLVEEFDT